HQGFESEYYFENGLRKVYPYHFGFQTFCKGRWVGRNIIDVMQKEFRQLPLEQFNKRCAKGLITVNGERISVGYVLKDNDKILNVVHRHELPVLACPIHIVHECKDLLIIDKPPSIPVHPCGRYRLNSVMLILKREYGYNNLYSKLDRLTSGLLIMAKTKEKAKEVIQQIEDRVVEKEYVCKVEGEFPEGEVICDEPIDRLTHKIGIFYVDKNGKESVTRFEKISSNGKTSIVRCKPKTGRTHQIRVHLQFLGYPIINDGIYNSFAFGPNKGKNGDFGGKSKEQLIADLLNEHPIEQWYDNDSLVPPIDLDQNNVIASSPLNSFEFGIYSETEEMKKYMESTKFDCTKFQVVEDCEECLVKFRDPKPEKLFMYLHCLRYKVIDRNIYKN
ncbi:uncharacterized protein B4U79_04929, partial [Dinothrombium tinctorium]